MSTENEKLKQVIKSCKGVRIVAVILLIMSIVGSVLTFIGGVTFIADGDHLDSVIQQGIDEGKIDVEGDLSGNHFMNIDLPNPDNMTSSVPALQTKFDEGSYSFMFAIYLFTISALIAVTAVVLALFNSVFSIIIKEATPFCDKVIRRLLISLILVTLFVGLTVGWGFAILCGFVTWAIITIMEYGKQLQIQSDETL